MITSLLPVLRRLPDVARVAAAKLPSTQTAVNVVGQSLLSAWFGHMMQTKASRLDIKA